MTIEEAHVEEVEAGAQSEDAQNRGEYGVQDGLEHRSAAVNYSDKICRSSWTAAGVVRLGLGRRLMGVFSISGVILRLTRIGPCPSRMSPMLLAKSSRSSNS